MEENKKNEDLYKNELLIKRTIKEHLKIEDEEQAKAMEKLLIYNLLN
ncbi:MAG: hypothetical protein HGA49_10205 [Eubacteriaceae bacterium]|nr:hypothetical protein [Eubacteriaceae bacterium]